MASQVAKSSGSDEDAGKYIYAFKKIQYAQLLAPYESYYFYQEAKLWLKAVRAQHSKDAAEKADTLLIEAISKNPFKKYLLLQRAILHRDYASLLSKPADINTILKWHEEVLDWQIVTKNNAAETEYIKSLIKAGRLDEARKLQAKLQQELFSNKNLNELLKKAFNPDKK